MELAYSTTHWYSTFLETQVHGTICLVLVHQEHVWNLLFSSCIQLRVLGPSLQKNSWQYSKLSCSPSLYVTSVARSHSWISFSIPAWAPEKAHSQGRLTSLWIHSINFKWVLLDHLLPDYHNSTQNLVLTFENNYLKCTRSSQTSNFPKLSCLSSRRWCVLLLHWGNRGHPTHHVSLLLYPSYSPVRRKKLLISWELTLFLSFYLLSSKIFLQTVIALNFISSGFHKKIV